MLVAYIPLKKACHVYGFFLDLFNRCTQNINFILRKIGKSSVLNGLIDGPAVSCGTDFVLQNLALLTEIAEERSGHSYVSVD